MIVAAVQAVVVVNMRTHDLNAVPCLVAAHLASRSHQQQVSPPCVSLQLMEQAGALFASPHYLAYCPGAGDGAKTSNSHGATKLGAMAVA